MKQCLPADNVSSARQRIISSCVGAMMFAVATALCGCSAMAPRPNQAKPPLVHTVKYSGETLSHIAGWYTGKAANWPAIARVNPKLNPNRLKVGDNITIPSGLLMQTKPFSRSFLQRGLGTSTQIARQKGSKENSSTVTTASADGSALGRPDVPPADAAVQPPANESTASGNTLGSVVVIRRGAEIEEKKRAVLDDLLQ